MSYAATQLLPGGSWVLSAQFVAVNAGVDATISCRLVLKLRGDQHDRHAGGVAHAG